MKTGQEILEELLSDLSVKLPTFAKEIGMSYRSMFDIQKGRVKNLSPSVAKAINAKFPQYSMSYLMTGDRDAVVGNEVNGNGNVIGNNNDIHHTDVINKLVDELSAQRRQNDRLIAIIEEQTKALTSKER